ncbi:Putative Cys/Met metabolism pyridoxal-phosphate-dependent enzyme [gamma proteobacterium HdN1]|nr:Putative Cys/Met metabolism pyridoxal-phosphate-dependent enzyme [gamma proteobacterium HdN1]
MNDWNHQDDWAIETLAIRTGQVRTEFGEHSEPIFATSSFVFNSAEQAAARFSKAEPGFIYSRFSNPTVAAFETRLAAMEGAEQCVATASGMSAIMAVMQSLLQSGDEILSSYSIFGTTNVLFEKYLRKFGIQTNFVSQTDVAAWREAITPKTRLLFLETPSNPLAEIADIRAIAEIAHEAGAILVVDNCFCTPALQRPLALGADIVIHSATKFLDGQGRCIGGAVVGPSRYLEEVYGYLRTVGPTMSPFNAWVFLKGLETLSLRMQAHSTSAQRLAEWLEQQPAIERVHYAGLASHPQHALASSQQDGYGGIVSFEVRGGKEQAWKLINGTKIFSITANLGDTKSTLTHPATTTHGRLTPEERQRAGIKDNLIRMAVGLENVNDLKRDLIHALEAIDG